MTLGLGDSARRSMGGVPLRQLPPGKPVGRIPVSVVVQRAPWLTRYTRCVIATDLVATGMAVTANVLLGFGSNSTDYGPVSAPLSVITWTTVMACLLAYRAWEPRHLGSGSEEFSRLIRAFTSAGVLLALLGLATLESAVRPWVFGVVPLAALLVFVGRVVLRKALHRKRVVGQCMQEVLAVGDEQALPSFVARTRRDQHTGWRVTGVCTPTAAAADGSRSLMGVPVVGDLDAVAAIARSGQYRAVAVGPTPGWTSARLRQLAWDLEGTGVELVVDPGLMEVAGPRLHIAPVDGLPLLRLTQPDLSGTRWLVKHTLDRVGALLLLLVLTPILLAVAIAVKLDGGPVFYRQTRIGRHGNPFSMVKFRSMVVNAEGRRAEFAADSDGAGPMFKLRRDPRVTRVGAVLRRYSLDELPQLFNVLGGTMTLVGPRPPLPEEVATYGRDAHRRLLVRPGLTGLWQVSGRSDLTWEESVRLDLRYVENWSLALDALILWKTIGAVLRGMGAY